VSCFFAFAASNEPLASYLNYDLLGYIFTKVMPVNGLICNFFLGVAVSYVFYFLVVFLPERRAKNHIKPILSKRVKKINDAVERMIRDISLVSGIELQYLNLDKNSLKEALSKVNSNSTHKRFVYSKPRKDATGQYLIEDGKFFFDKYCYSLNQRLAHEWSIVRRTRMDLFELYGLLSLSMIQELDSLENLAFDFLFADNVNTIQYTGEQIYELYDFSKKLKQAVEY